METIEKAKQLMEEGWKTREAGEHDKAELLLNQAKKIFEENEDWFNVTECLGHLAYTYKSRAMASTFRGLALANESLRLAEEKGTKKPSVYRALVSLQETAGLFEAAFKYAKKYEEVQGKPLDKADMLSHESTFLLRMGKIDEAYEMVEKSLEMFEEHKDPGKEPHNSIWISRALGAKAIILYDMGKLDEAKELLHQALKITTENNLKMRTTQIQFLLKELF